MLLYTRATHSKAQGRNKLQITAHLDDRQRGLHDRVTALRDRYLAHFEDASGWEEHCAIFAVDIDGSKMSLSYPHSSAYIQPAEAIDFDHLLGLVLPIAQRQSDKVSLKLNLALNELFEMFSRCDGAVGRSAFRPRQLLRCSRGSSLSRQHWTSRLRCADRTSHRRPITIMTDQNDRGAT